MTSSFRTPAKKSVLIRLFWGFFLLFLLHHPKQTSQAVVLGLTICATRLIPSLFPLMVLSVFASHSGVCTAFGQFLCRLTKDRMNLGNAGWGAFFFAFNFYIKSNYFDFNSYVIKKYATFYI